MNAADAPSEPAQTAAPPPAGSSNEMPDSFAVRLAAGFLGPQWKQSHDRKKRLERRTVLSDCRLMLRYALDEGCIIPEPLAKDIASIDNALIRVQLDPLSEVPAPLIEVSSFELPIAPTGDVGPSPAQPEPINDVVMRVHNALAGLVAPATAQSLRATDPAIVSMGLPLIAKFAILGSLICTGLFVYFVKVEVPGSAPRAGSPAAGASATPSSS